MDQTRNITKGLEKQENSKNRERITDGTDRKNHNKKSHVRNYDKKSNKNFNGKSGYDRKCNAKHCIPFRFCLFLCI